MKRLFILAVMAVVATISASAQEPAVYNVKTAKVFIEVLGNNRIIVINITQPLNITEAVEKMIAAKSITAPPSFLIVFVVTKKPENGIINSRQAI